MRMMRRSVPPRGERRALQFDAAGGEAPSIRRACGARLPVAAAAAWSAVGCARCGGPVAIAAHAADAPAARGTAAAPIVGRGGRRTDLGPKRCAAAAAGGSPLCAMRARAQRKRRPSRRRDRRAWRSRMARAGRAPRRAASPNRAMAPSLAQIGALWDEIDEAQCDVIVQRVKHASFAAALLIKRNGAQARQSVGGASAPHASPPQPRAMRARHHRARAERSVERETRCAGARFSVAPAAWSDGRSARRSARTAPTQSAQRRRTDDSASAALVRFGAGA